MASSVLKPGQNDGSIAESSPLIIRLLAMALAAGAVTFLCCFALGSVGNVYPTPDEVLNLGAAPTPEERSAASVAKYSADLGNNMVLLGITGAIFGGVFALTTGFLHRAGKRTLFGAIGGIILAGGMGCLAGYVSSSYHASVAATMIGSASDSEHHFMKMHGLTWALVGVGIGLACGLTRPRIEGKQVLLSMIVAGVCGGIAGVSFPLIAAMAAPLVDSSLPIAEPGFVRAVWVGLASVMVGLGVGRTS